MNSGENLKNALTVMYETYDNIQKLMVYCKSVASEETHYELSTSRFLRRKSDNVSDAWLLNDFILLFQNSNSAECESENGWKNDAVYVLEICLGERGSEKLPCIYLSKFEYEDINKWTEGCSPANYWVFFNPLRNANEFNLTNTALYTVRKPKDSRISNAYWGVKKVTTKSLDLMSINSDNIKDAIFDEFDRLTTHQ